MTNDLIDYFRVLQRQADGVDLERGKEIERRIMAGETPPVIEGLDWNRDLNTVKMNLKHIRDGHTITDDEIDILYQRIDRCQGHIAALLSAIQTDNVHTQRILKLAKNYGTVTTTGLAQATSLNPALITRTLLDAGWTLKRHRRSAGIFSMEWVNPKRKEKEFICPPCPTHPPDVRCVMCHRTYEPTIEEVQEAFNEECQHRLPAKDEQIALEKFNKSETIKTVITEDGRILDVYHLDDFTVRVIRAALAQKAGQ